MEEMDKMEYLVPMDHQERRETKGQLDQGMVGWSTQGGRKLPVQESQVPHWCTQRGLVERGIAIREEQPISSVCLMIQTISATYLEFKDTTMCMEQSIRHMEHHCQLFKITMSICTVYHTSTRVAVTMIPAKTQCPSTWTLEYSGYLMSAYLAGDRHPTMYECVDKNPDSVPGSVSDANGALFYHVEANCNGMACPPYDPQKELTCAVCTK